MESDKQFAGETQRDGDGDAVSPYLAIEFAKCRDFQQLHPQSLSLRKKIFACFCTILKGIS